MLKTAFFSLPHRNLLNDGIPIPESPDADERECLRVSIISDRRYQKTAFQVLFSHIFY